jgi:hypothetical protein
LVDQKRKEKREERKLEERREKRGNWNREERKLETKILLPFTFYLPSTASPL